MGSTFGAYNVAYSGMFASQAALAATSANLANVSTTGASRVRVAVTEGNVIETSGNAVGDGASVASITRTRNQFLDSTYRSQNAKAGYLSVKSGNLEYMDKILSEFDTDEGDSGIQQAVDDFFSAWENAATDPSSQSTRAAVTTAAADLLNTLSEVDEQLRQLQSDAVNGVTDGVDKLNDLAGQVAELNGQITQAEAGGGEASYLRDQRDELLDEMSSLADIKAVETSNGLQVSLGGVNLVNGTSTHTLAVEGDGSANQPLTVVWQELDCNAVIQSGSIKAYMEDADQSGYSAIDTNVLPYSMDTNDTDCSISTMRQALNDLITTLAAKINSLHTSGVDLDGNAGLDFFTAIDSSKPLSIDNIQVNPKLTADTNKIAAGSSAADGDNTVASEICALSKEECYQCNGLSLNVTNYYAAVISWIGTAGDTATNSYDTQTALVDQVDTQRQSVCSISNDEEMSNMIKFQNAYAANARVMSTIDGLLGDLMDIF